MKASLHTARMIRNSNLELNEPRQQIPNYTEVLQAEKRWWGPQLIGFNAIITVTTDRSIAHTSVTLQFKV